MFISIREPMLFPREQPALDQLLYPLLAFYKYDGVRCFIGPAGPLSRTMKQIPNRQLRERLSVPELAGIDCEVVVGDPNRETVFQDTSRLWRTADMLSNDIRVYVFDHLEEDGLTEPFLERYMRAAEIVADHPGLLTLAPSKWVHNPVELSALESEAHRMGYEGLILRNPDGRYKVGRATMRENLGYKLKRFVDDEAEIIGFEEMMTNTNPAFQNEAGHQVRSQDSAGLVGAGVLGALVVKHPTLGVFKIGSGFSALERASLWAIRDTLCGLLVTFKYMPYGMVNTARLPIYRGIRAEGQL